MPPYSSDVRKLRKINPLPNHPRPSQTFPSHIIAKRIKHDKLQSTKIKSSSDPESLVPGVGGGSSSKKNRRELISPRRHGIELNTIPILEVLLDTCTDE
jgi:hypothetical protein